jgi:DNA repair protein RecO
MFEYNTQAIVLDKDTINEADANVILYTENLGKIELIAKGAKKITAKLNAHLEPLNLIEATIIAANNKHLTSVLTINNFYRIRKNYLLLENALKMLKLFNQAIVANEKDELIWQLLNNYLNNLNSEKLSQMEGQKMLILMKLFNLEFLFNLTKALGMMPDFEEINRHFSQQTVFLIKLLESENPQNILEKFELSKLEKIDYNKIENEIKQKIII